MPFNALQVIIDLAAHVVSPHGPLDIAEVGDISSSNFGDSALAGTTGDAADGGHRHAREANPLTAHEAASNPHPTYLTAAEGDAAYSAFGHGHVVDFGEVGDVVASTFGDTTAAGATGEVADAGHRHGREANPVTAHEAAGDPHTGYVREADANWVDLTDGGASTLHSHAGGGSGSDPFVGSYAPGTFTVATGKYAMMGQRLELTGSQVLTLEGTSTLLILGR